MPMPMPAPVWLGSRTARRVLLFEEVDVAEFMRLELAMHQGDELPALSDTDGDVELAAETGPKAGLGGQADDKTLAVLVETSFRLFVVFSLTILGR
jgi:hypothetical protein